MKVEILSDVMISGEPALAGSFVEVSRVDAQLLINSNKAQVSSEAEAAQPTKVTPPSDEAAQPTEAAPPASAPKRSRKSDPTPEA